MVESQDCRLFTQEFTLNNAESLSTGTQREYRDEQLRGMYFFHEKLLGMPSVKYQFCPVVNVSTCRGRDKMTAIFQTTYSNAISWIEIVVFWWKFHWNMFSRTQLTVFQHCFRLNAGVVQATSHCLNWRWPSLLTHICLTWVVTLRPEQKRLPSNFKLILLYKNSCIWIQISETFVPNCPMNNKQSFV